MTTGDVQAVSQSCSLSWRRKANKVQDEVFSARVCFFDFLDLSSFEGCHIFYIPFTSPLINPNPFNNSLFSTLYNRTRP